MKAISIHLTVHFQGVLTFVSLFWAQVVQDLQACASERICLEICFLPTKQIPYRLYLLSCNAICTVCFHYFRGGGGSNTWGYQVFRCLTLNEGTTNPVKIRFSTEIFACTVSVGLQKVPPLW
jgi:hypothetical protein